MVVAWSQDGLPIKGRPFKEGSVIVVPWHHVVGRKGCIVGPWTVQSPYHLFCARRDNRLCCDLEVVHQRFKKQEKPKKHIPRNPLQSITLSIKSRTKHCPGRVFFFQPFGSSRFLGSWFAPLASHCPLSVEGGSKSGEVLGQTALHLLISRMFWIMHLWLGVFPETLFGAEFHHFSKVLLQEFFSNWIGHQRNQSISKPSLPVAAGIALTFSTSSFSLQRALDGRWLTFVKS